MKIGIAQIQPVAGDINNNIKRHVELINCAINKGVQLVYFPELSITDYEPSLAKTLVASDFKSQFEVFQGLSDNNDIVIGVGAPLPTHLGIQIAMHWFQKAKPQQTYAKQMLHQDELPYFVPGDKQLILEVAGKKIAPAICYESLQTEHAQSAFELSADIYLASVAKSSTGISKAMQHFPTIAKHYKKLVVLANCIGHCDDFLSTGNSSAWGPDGELLAQLDRDNEGLLIVDTNNYHSDIINL